MPHSGKKLTIICKRNERKDADFGAEVKNISHLSQDDRPEEDTEVGSALRHEFRLELGEENHHCLCVHTGSLSTT